MQQDILLPTRGTPTGAPDDSAIRFIDLERQQAAIRPALERNIKAVLDHGRYIMGPEVATLEARLAAFCGARHAISCANGTDALVLALRALGIGQGDCVIVPSFTFCATAEAVCLVGATPLFVDVEADSFTMDPASLAAGIALAKRQGLGLKAVIAVDLFGQPCDYAAIEPLVRTHGLHLVCDAAQAFGASCASGPVGTIGDITTTSFFPAKPLGCYGDGGALFTADDGLAEVLRSLRVHGQGRHKYDNVRIGTNSRLDTMQAAILLAKLDVYADEIGRRDAVAMAYAASLDDNALTLPRVRPGARSVWAQYTIRTSSRDALAARLKAAGIPTAVYYATPLHLQAGYAGFPHVMDEGSVSAELAGSVLSLPMHPYLEAAEIDRIAKAAGR